VRFSSPAAAFCLVLAATSSDSTSAHLERRGLQHDVEWVATHPEAAEYYAEDHPYAAEQFEETHPAQAAIEEQYIEAENGKQYLENLESELAASASYPHATENTDTSHLFFGGHLGILSLCLALLFLAAVVYAAVMHRLKTEKKERAVLMEVTNLRSYRHQSDHRAWSTLSTLGLRRQRSPYDDFRGLNLPIGLEVRNSASGGRHGIYDDDQLQAINFGASDSSEGGEESFVGVRNHGVYSDDDHLLSQDNIRVISPSGSVGGGEGLDELKEIEDGLDNYVIGDMDNDVSDDDLIKAYNDAMALDTELESEDVDFSMKGFGSDKTVT